MAVVQLPPGNAWATGDDGQRANTGSPLVQDIREHWVPALMIVVVPTILLIVQEALPRLAATQLEWFFSAVGG